MKKLKRLLGILITITVASSMTGCTDKKSSVTSENSSELEQVSTIITSDTKSTKYFSDFDLKSDYDDITATINLDNENTIIDGTGVSFDDKTVTITKGGTFYLSGIMSDGQIYVNAEENVQLVFDGVNIANSSSAPVFVENAKNVSITLADNSENILSDTENYVFTSADENEPDAVIFSKDDLSINGNGKLTVNANYNEGITTKNDLRISGGNIEIKSVGNGIKGKDSVVVQNTSLTIDSGEDGIKTSNSEEKDKGYIVFESGTFNITAQNDAVQTETFLTVNDGEYNFKTGDGADSVQNNKNEIPQMNGEVGMPGGGFERPQMPTGENGEMNIQSEKITDDETTESQKGFKVGTILTINGGNIKTDCVDDSIHAGDDIQINNGEFNLNTGDDGIHSDSNVNIENGNITINKCYEGIEGIVITVNGGEVTIIASDDGLNASDGTTNSADPMASSPNCAININGGKVSVNADGDGMDSNGSITINDGEVIVESSEMGADSALDCGVEILLNGGTVLALGGCEMLETPSDSSKQNIVVVAFDSQQNINTKISMTDESDKEIISYTSSKKYTAAIISTPNIEKGKEYGVLIDDELVEKIKIEDIVTTIGNVANGQFGGRGSKNFGNRDDMMPFNENNNASEL